MPEGNPTYEPRHTLKLTLFDVPDPAAFLKALGAFLAAQDATANGVLHVAVNPVSGWTPDTIRILNNTPDLRRWKEAQP